MNKNKIARTYLAEYRAWSNLINRTKKNKLEKNKNYSASLKEINKIISEEKDKIRKEVRELQQGSIERDIDTLNNF